MSETITNTNGNVATNGHPPTNGHARTNGQARKTNSSKASQQDIVALIEQAEKFRTALHDLMYEASGLVKALDEVQQLLAKPLRRRGRRFRQQDGEFFGRPGVNALVTHVVFRGADHRHPDHGL